MKPLRPLISSLLICFVAFGAIACDDCSGAPEETTEPDMKKVTPKPEAKAEKEEPKEDPLKKAREDATEKAQLGAFHTADIGRLAAANIEGAQQEEEPKARIRGNTRPEATGSIDPKEAAKVFRKYEGAMKKCYERALKKTPGLEGKVTLNVLVAPDGSVKTSRARPISLQSSQVENCMETLAKRMKFPKPKGGVASLNKPYSFQPQL